MIATDNPFLKSNSQRLQCAYKELPRIVKPNDVIYIDDGKIVCLVTECEQVHTYITHSSLSLSLEWDTCGGERWWDTEKQSEYQAAQR